MLRRHKSTKKHYSSSSLPKKRISVGVLLFYKGDLLILQPTQAKNWTLPGGPIDHDESPLEGLHREILTRLQIKIEVLSLIAVDYVHNTGQQGEYLHFLFAAQDLKEDQVQALQLSPYEFKDYKFASLERAYLLLRPELSRRLAISVKSAEEQNTALYLEDGYDPLISYKTASHQDLGPQLDT